VNSLTASAIQAQLLQARAAIAQRQFTAALKTIEDVLTADPSNSEAMKMAMELGEQDEQARLEEIERVQQASSVEMNLQPSTEFQHLESAKGRLREKQYDLALADITLALLDNPLNDEALQLELEIQDALLSAKKSELDNSSPTLNAVLLTARRYLEREKLELALEEVNAGLKIDVSHPELLWLRNTIVEQMQTRELRRLQDRKNALILGVRELFVKTEFRQALESLHAAQAEFPNDSELKTLALEIEDAHGKWDELKQYEQKSAEVNEFAKRARQLLRTNQVDEAIQEVVFGLLADPYNQNLRKLETELWTVLEKKEEAQRQEEAKVEKEKEFARVTIHLVAAQEFSMYGQFARALDEIANAYAIDPTNSEIKQLETSIRQQQHRSVAVPLKLVYNEQRRTNGS
jgi:hypothetical protein